MKESEIENEGKRILKLVSNYISLLGFSYMLSTCFLPLALFPSLSLPFPPSFLPLLLPSPQVRASIRHHHEPETQLEEEDKGRGGLNCEGGRRSKAETREEGLRRFEGIELNWTEISHRRGREQGREGGRPWIDFWRKLIFISLSYILSSLASFHHSQTGCDRIG